jgi:hypothetical protein
MKEDLTRYVKSQKKAEILEINSSLSQIKNTVESNSSSLEQVEDRIKRLEGKIDIKERTYNSLDKGLKGYKWNMQKLCDAIQRPNPRDMDIEDEVHVTGVGNIFNKIRVEKFLNLEKVMPIHVQETSRITNRHEQNRTSPWHIIVKKISTENKEKTLKAVRE